MKRLYFSGVLHPERALLSLGSPTLEIMNPDGKRFAVLKFNIVNNQISAFMDCEDDQIDFFTLRNAVKLHIHTFVNAIGFVKGRAYDVEVTKVFTSDLEETLIFGIDIPVLEERNAHLKLNDSIDHILLLCHGHDGIYLRRCLDDLAMSMRYLDDTPFYCYRALESIKQYFGKKFNLPNDKDKEQWKKFADAIGGKKDDLDVIRKLAFPARHGVPEPISDQQRVEIFMKTWNVVERFIDYRLEELGYSYRILSIKP
jgi:hypothetical protein